MYIFHHQSGLLEPEQSARALPGYICEQFLPFVRKWKEKGMTKDIWIDYDPSVISMRIDDLSKYS